MKRITTVLVVFLFSVNYSISQSSEEPTFSRNGRFLIETGYNIVGGINNSTGANLQINFDGGSVSALGADVGKFLSENFALKFKLGLLSGTGLSITTVTGGAKYYAGGKIPIELTAGIIDTGLDNPKFNGNFKFGYAARLADNITLEPSLGLTIIYDESAFVMGISFAMFL